MAKKKSKRFIIPSFHFLTHSPEPKSVDEAFAEVQPVKPEIKKQSAALTQGAPSSTREAVQENSQQPLPRPKPLELRKKGRRNSALSLSSLKRKKEEEEALLRKKEETRDESQLPHDPFTEAQFLDVWNSYIKGLHEQGEKILASVLKADRPKIKGSLICLTYPNELMKTELLKVRPRVLRYIREKLNNHGIDFEITVNEGSSKRFAYTPQEKYELLKEKNEAISVLRRTFNLEL